MSLRAHSSYTHDPSREDQHHVTTSRAPLVLQTATRLPQPSSHLPTPYSSPPEYLTGILPLLPDPSRRRSLGRRPRWRWRRPSRWRLPSRRSTRRRCGWTCHSRGPSACLRRSSPTWWCSPTIPSCSSPTPTRIPPSPSRYCFSAACLDMHSD